MIFKPLLLLILTLSINAYAQTYTTLNDGDWLNTTNVWSLDGINPCFCAPSLSTDDNVVINHSVTSSSDISFIAGSNLLINGGGNLSGSFVLSFNSSTATINGNVSIAKLFIDADSEINFNSSILTVTSQMNIFGTVNVDSGYLLMTGGNIIINSGAVFNTINSGKVDVQNGNISNSGEFNLCATCCFTTSGNWKNNLTGRVLGSGAATSTNGNMTNNGLWSPTVFWCSNGTSTGMPGFENCGVADVICSIVVLSVEFGGIEVNENESGIPVITWFTLSERDNAYFQVWRLSNDGGWKQLGVVSGAGNTQDKQEYHFVDYEFNYGDNYYKIEQVDYNGESSSSEIVYFNMSEVANTMVYPNPVNSDASLSLITNYESDISVKLINMMGAEVYSNTSSKSRFNIDLSNLRLQEGIYMLEVSDLKSRQLTKVIITN